MQTKNFAPKVWKRPYTSTYPINWKYGKGLYEPVVESLSVSSKGFAPSLASDYSYSTLPRSFSTGRSFDVYPLGRLSRARSIMDFNSDISRHDEYIEEDVSRFGLQKSRSMANFALNNEDKYRRSKIEMNRLKRKREMEGALRGNSKWY